ncbi:MAG: leucine-rich repeat domain-containing protein, partial [Oscillospiraceae bacterium]|nr:leucine-rich repeat domain-containing protein [Oscillospiraceae bacterium]
MNIMRMLGLLTAAATLTACCGASLPGTYLREYLLTASAETDESGKCGENLTWEYQSENRLLTISGIGEMYDFLNPEGTLPWADKFIESVVVTEGVTSIGERAFAWNYNLKEVTLPDSVTTIKRMAFRDTSITELHLPAGLRKLESGCFCSCQNLTELVLPDKLDTIGWYAFAECEHLKRITFPQSITTISAEAFSDTAWIQAEREKNPLVTVNHFLIDGENASGKVKIPDGVTEICDRSFANNEGITSVTLPDSVKRIGEEAFCGCSNLTDVTLPKGLTGISDGTFSYCRCLTDITLPDTITKIGENAFADCLSLENLTLPKGVTEIGSGAFQACGLESVSIPESVTEIGDEAFCECRALTSIKIPGSVSVIGERVFSDCCSLTDISFSKGLSVIGSHAFAGCFQLGGVVLPDGLKEIGDSAFSGCSSMASVQIPESVTDIAASAFYECNTVLIIGVSGSAAKQYAKEKALPFIEWNPDAETYIIASGEFTSDENGNFTWSLNSEGELTVSGTGDMPEWKRSGQWNMDSDVPWFVYRKCIKTVSLKGTITSIGSCAFEDCLNLHSFAIPDSVKTIGEYAFCNCCS